MTSMNPAANATGRRQPPPGLGDGAVLVRYDGSTIAGPLDACAEIPFGDLQGLSPEIAEGLVRHHGVSIFGPPVIYAQLRLEDLKHLPADLVAELGEELEGGAPTAFFKEDGREAWLFVDTDAREDWLDRAFDEFAEAGLPIENAVGDLKGMANADHEFEPPHFPYWIEAGLTDLDLDAALARVGDLRDGLAAEDPYAVSVPRPF